MGPAVRSFRIPALFMKPMLAYAATRCASAMNVPMALWPLFERTQSALSVAMTSLYSRSISRCSESANVVIHAFGLSLRAHNCINLPSCFTTRSPSTVTSS